MFSVQILVDNQYVRKSLTRNGVYVSLPTETGYRIELQNHHNTRCEAEIAIDGEYIGKWIVPPNNAVLIDGPQFTFSSISYITAKFTPISKSALRYAVLDRDNIMTTSLCIRAPELPTTICAPKTSPLVSPELGCIDDFTLN